MSCLNLIVHLSFVHIQFKLKLSYMNENELQVIMEKNFTEDEIDITDS